MEASRDITRLLDIMAALRTPETGCPWDLKQDFDSIKPYTIEEAYEVADAIERKDFDDLCDELGDLLLQVVFHARMAEEKGLFSFGDVVHFAVNPADTPEAVKIQWDEIKRQEKAERAERRAKSGITEDFKAGHLGGVQRSFPALTEALKLQEHAARVGFDWSEPEPILAKFEEEIGELREALQTDDKSRISDELGDLIFAAVNLARHTKTDPEQALRGTNTKFRRRFNHIEESLNASGETLDAATLERMEALWQDAKAIERQLAE